MLGFDQRFNSSDESDEGCGAESGGEVEGYQKHVTMKIQLKQIKQQKHILF